MEQNYSKYTDEMLVNMMENGLDLDEEVFFVLSELGSRKHPRTKEFCLDALNRDLGFDEYFVSSALGTLYSFDEEAAIDYAKQHYKEFHIYSLGELVSLFWVDSEQENSDKKKELIKLIKDHLKTFKKEEIAEIKNDYDEFMKAYKNV